MGAHASMKDSKKFRIAATDTNLTPLIAPGRFKWIDFTPKWKALKTNARETPKRRQIDGIRSYSGSVA
jgi:hypothetical protein